MLCELCVRWFKDFRPVDRQAMTRTQITTGHTLSLLLQGSQTGCEVCYMIYKNLQNATPAPHEALPPEQSRLLNISIRFKLQNLMLPDQLTRHQNVTRLDAYCGGKHAALELVSLPRPLVDLLQGMNDNPSPDLDTGSENCINLLQYWTRECKENHVNCRALYTQTPAERCLPKRLIDVGPHDGSVEPRLIDTGLMIDSYVALSHVWGSKPVLRTTKANLQDHLQQIPMSSLPKTFRHAVVVCRRLGMQYLWIDALCIVQDDELDWRQGALSARDIYKTAWLTIVAAAAKDSSEGLFRRRDGRRRRPCQSGMTEGSPGNPTPLSLRRLTNPKIRYLVQVDSKGMVGEIGHRGWALQEHVMAPRVVWFRSDTIFWTCPSCEACERIPEGVFENDRKTLTRWPATQHAIHDETLPLPLGSVKRLYVTWYQMVMEYSRRKFTVDNDKAYALAGLAEEMTNLMARAAKVDRAFPDSLFGGIWVGDIWRGLLWTVVPEGNMNVGAHRPSRLMAPTWSWLSTMGAVTYLSYASRLNDLMPYQALSKPVPWNWATSFEVDRLTSMPIDPIQYTPLFHGKLTLKGRLGQGLAVAGGHLMHSDTGERLGTWLQDDKRWTTQIVHCFPIAEMVLKDPENVVGRIWCLALVKIEGVKGTYRRVGVAMISEDCVGWMGSASPCKVAIV